MDASAFEKYYDIVTEVCYANYGKADLGCLLNRLLNLEGPPTHCPVHHYIVPASLLTVCLAKRGKPAEMLRIDLSEALERAREVPGMVCGYSGCCGAAVGVGIFWSIIMDVTPTSESSWGLIQRKTAESLSAIAETGGPRCCKRGTYIAARRAAEQAAELLKLDLGIESSIECGFWKQNRECIEARCPFYPEEEIARQAQSGKESGPISLYLISGFLGSGKTTLLRRILDGYAGGRVGVIVNEFGEIGIDGTLLATAGIRMVEINGGAIFCACLKDDFVKTLKAFGEQPVDTIFIENSGMSDPSSMNRLLADLAPYLKRPFDYRGSICLVDCTSFTKYADVFLPLERQVEASTFVVLNKTDLCAPGQVEAAEDKVREINPDAFVTRAVHADVPLNLMRERVWNSGWDERSMNRVNNRPESIELEDAEGLYLPADVEVFCRSLEDAAMRIKGFFAALDGSYYVDVSSGILDIRRDELAQGGISRGARIVVIARGGTDCAGIAEAWSALRREDGRG